VQLQSKKKIVIASVSEAIWRRIKGISGGGVKPLNSREVKQSKWKLLNKL
jgi:hypothetical protein